MSSKHDLSRRTFLGTAGGAAAVGALGPFSGVAGAHGRKRHGRDDNEDYGFGRGGDIPLDRIGIQLFTVRDLLADNELDLPGTFEVLGDAGYALVEVGGTYDGRTAAQFKQLANDYGLRPEGMHPPAGGTRWTTPEGRRAIYEESVALGLKWVGAASPPNGYTRDTAGFTRMAADFNTWGAEARRYGLKFYFHNHSEDFNLDANGRPIYDIPLTQTDPRLVYFEMDIAWVVGGGQDPYAYLRRYGSKRFPLFHVKDLTFTPPPNPPAAAPRTTPATAAQPNRPYWLRDVGKGDIDFAHVFSALRDPGAHLPRRARRRARRRDGQRAARRAAVAEAAQPRRLGQHGVDEPQVPREPRDPRPAPLAAAGSARRAVSPRLGGRRAGDHGGRAPIALVRDRSGRRS